MDEPLGGDVLLEFAPAGGHRRILCWLDQPWRRSRFSARPAPAAHSNVAQAIGEGDLSAAPELAATVTALARAFNQMAGDLGARTRRWSCPTGRRQLLADVRELKTPLAAIRGTPRRWPCRGAPQEDTPGAPGIVGDETVKLQAHCRRPSRSCEARRRPH
jgi:signal transduction histidine kinase